MTTDTFTYACSGCGGTISVVGGSDQPHDCGGLTMDLTSALIRSEHDVLVRIERRWDAADRWQVGVDRAQLAGGYIADQVVDGWVEATSTAARMARDVLAHATTIRSSGAHLQASWPRRGSEATS